MIAVSIDGELVAPEAASVSVFDRGFLYGDGCFEVLRTWAGVAVDLERHLDRLYATARFLELKAISAPELTAAVHATLAAAGPGEHRIRTVLSRGQGPLSVPFADLPRGRAIVIVEPLPSQPTELSLAVVDWPVPRHGIGRKTLAYLDPLIARELARAAGADEAVRLDGEGHVVEGATCNVFAVIGGEVVTPPVELGALPGVTRGRVIEVCGSLGVAVRERSLTPAELDGAAELFVTSALRGVVAVTRLDGEARSAGPLTERLSHAYTDVMRAAATVI